MEKQKLIDTLSETSEDRLLLAKVYDKISAGERKNIPASTCFLTGREQELARQPTHGKRLGRLLSLSAIRQLRRLAGCTKGMGGEWINV